MGYIYQRQQNGYFMNGKTVVGQMLSEPELNLSSHNSDLGLYNRWFALSYLIDQ